MSRPSLGQILGVSAGVTAAATGALGYLFFRRALPKVDGTDSVLGIDRPVEIVRDRWGIPHIYAETTRDLYFALGYVHAQDRLWHMELNRRAAQGRLSEMFGAVTIGLDRMVRRVGIGSVALAEVPILDDEERAILDAYTAGVNVVIQRQHTRLPLEYILLRMRPEPWSAVDTLAWSKLMGWMLSGNWDAELVRSALVAELGVDVVAQIEPIYPTDHGTQIPATAPGAERRTDLLRDLTALADYTGLGAGAGSNAWCVSAARSVTGGTLLASDPHLRPQMPSIWYEAHLVGPNINVTGVTLPGAPAVLIGHNDRIAWGITASMVDTQDLFVEQIDPADRTRYRTPTGWATATVRREEIRVRGQKDPVVEEVTVTRHGPSLTPLFPHEQRTVCLQSTALRPNPPVRSTVRLNRARNWDEFRDALRAWSSPALNFIYADRDGHIGYHLGGEVPLRRRGSGLVPVPGWDDSHEWDGFIPFDEMPHSLDDERGYYVSANNKIADDSYPYPLSNEWLDGYRADRIANRIESRTKHDVIDFQAYQIDEYSIAARQLVQLLDDVPTDDPNVALALDYLRRWDFRIGAESIAASIYEIARNRLIRNVFGSRLGKRIEGFAGRTFDGGFLGNLFSSRSTSALLELMRKADPAWLTGPAGTNEGGVQQAQTWPALKAMSLSQAVVELRAHYGDDPDGWRWGGMHQLTFEHPLGAVKVLKPIFSRGPFRIGGDGDTPKQAAPDFGARHDATSWVPSFRQVVDLKDWDRSVSIHTTGQSGQPGSKHYDDFVRIWLNGDGHPMLFTREEVLRAAEATLRLVPGGEADRERR